MSGAAACLANLTDDGVLNIFDMSTLSNAHNAQGPVAVYSGDGQLHIFDVSAFLGANNAGCS